MPFKTNTVVYIKKKIIISILIPFNIKHVWVKE